MPIYTYRCENCGVEFDRHQSFDDEPLVICPECNKKALYKVYKPAPIVFKGKGYYVTDHRSSARASSLTSSADSNGKTSEAKPEKAKESKAKPVEKTGDKD